MRPVHRRRLLQGGAAAVGLGALYPVLAEPRWLQVTRHEVNVSGLPPGLDGFRIAHLTDAHMASIGAIERAVIAAVHQHQPELVVLTGDMIESAGSLPALADLCRALQAPGRTLLATAGNWEHWGRISTGQLASAYESAAAILMTNMNRELGNGVVVVATDDHYSGYADWEAAQWRAPQGAFRLLLTHSPALFDALPGAGPRFDLCLAGHTHGGQARLGKALVRPPGSGSFDAGWYDTPAGRLYVSRGIGTSVLPARLFCRPEVAIFTLLQQPAS